MPDLDHHVREKAEAQFAISRWARFAAGVALSNTLWLESSIARVSCLAGAACAGYIAYAQVTKAEMALRQLVNDMQRDAHVAVQRAEEETRARIEAEREGTATLELTFCGGQRCRRAYGPSNRRPSAAAPTAGGFFMTTKPARSRCSTRRRATIAAMISPESRFRFRPSKRSANARASARSSGVAGVRRSVASVMAHDDPAFR